MVRKYLSDITCLQSTDDINSIVYIVEKKCI